MRWQQSVLRLASEVLSLGRVPVNPKQGLRILTYHSIGSSAYEDFPRLNSLSVERFIQDMDVVATFQSTALSTITIPQTEFKMAITFDDGYADNLYVAAPLLAARNIPFTVFIATDFIQNRAKGFLTPGELKELSLAPGASIGSHSHSHCNLTLCNNKALKVELADSKKYLEDLLGLPVTKFSYPYGLADMRVRDAVQQAGYEIGVCSRFDINRPGRDFYMLNRCVILAADTRRVFKQKINGAWDWYRWRAIDPLNIKAVDV